MFLIYDTETTGLPRNYEAPVSDLENWPRLVQLAWQLHDKTGTLIEAKNYIVKPDGFTIPYNSEKIHGISTEKAGKDGLDLKEVLKQFNAALKNADYVIGHNIDFDLNIVRAEFLRCGFPDGFEGRELICTKTESVDYCALPGGRGGGYKWPKLGELYQALFDSAFEDAHNAGADVVATARSFLEMIRIGVIDAKRLKVDEQFMEAFKKKHPGQVKPVQIDIRSNKEDHEGVTEDLSDRKIDEEKEKTSEAIFSHLHVHSQYSILQATPDVKDIVAAAKKNGMPAVALTDHGNMFGAYAFVSAAKKAGIKPVIGSEYYIATERLKKKFTNDNPDRRYLQVLLAKNKKGYENLSRLNSVAYIEGMYGLYPRIDKGLVEKYKEGLMATTGGIHSEVPELILNVGEHQAEEAFQWWLEQFGDDFYVQLNRHGLEEEKRTNEVLMRFAEKYNVKTFAANNVYYLKKKDAHIHDILLCIQNAEYQSTPIGKGRGFRYGFPNEEFYFKTQEEMRELFKDLPETIDNISEIIGKVEEYDLDRPPIMPDFHLPEGFSDADEYLKHQTWKGAEWRYKEITDDLRLRIDFELETIKKMGYPGYFLIIQDILNKAREMDVSVGPGRGSAAGSVVAYCLHITDIDPLKFNLLFERFLNPDRISLPDIDIDFDEDGRDRILKWVVKTYGEKRVAQIITFGRMAPKMAIRDIARVKQLPLNEADRLAKLVPLTPGTTFSDAYKIVPDLVYEKKEGEPLIKETLMNAEALEGTIRNTGTHACGIIIGKDDLIDLIPLSITKDSELLATQYDGNHIESVGMLKMDFLGLKTLSIIRDTIENIKRSRGVEIDIESLPYDDEKTYELYSKGETNGIFQFESEGMKKHLRELKPNRFEDLIAMNALYRPGPMKYIPKFIERKQGREKIEYELPEMKEILEETYGVTVYQEQVMLLSQKLADFTKGQADLLRKGMGKKIKTIIDELKPKFLDGCKNEGYDLNVVNKIWTDWEEFAKYAFNKSHSTCYAEVSYRMAYLKAHYPAEFLAAVLSRNLNDIKKITFLIDECRHQGIPVLGPCINESHLHFMVNKKGEIRFGMAAIKNVGESAVKAVVTERDKNGSFRNIFDFAKRVNLRAVNKRAMESMAMAGAFDTFSGVHRAQYFFREDNDDTIFLEKVIRHGAIFQEKQSSSQQSLFGDSMGVEIKDPDVPACNPWSKLHQLKSEREVTGFYISGHPMDDYRFEVDNFTNVILEYLNHDIKKYQDKTVSFAGMVVNAEHKTAKSGNKYGTFIVEDFTDSFRLAVFAEEYLKFKHLMVEETCLLFRARVEANRSNPKRLEVRVNGMTLLAEATEKFTKEVQLHFNLANLNPDFIHKIREVIQSNAGQCPLSIKVNDSEENLSVGFRPRKARVNPAGMLRDARDIPGLDVRVQQ